ncbi:MAG: PaaI family thioesterase [Pseudomonadales bacterium]|nr:PaaI family thioesterase [Pseudomonadales bacterium]
MTTLEDHMLAIPHARAIGMTLVRHDAEGSVVRVPYAEHLVGDPDTGVIHGGVLTALLDNTCGIAVRPPGGDAEGYAIATLDLRIDYMGSAEPHRDIFAEAVCYKRTRNIAFVRASAYQHSPDEPIATCVAAFMLGTRSEPRPTEPPPGPGPADRTVP